MTAGSLIGWCLALYGVVGLGVAAAFSLKGAERIMPGSPALSLGTRLLILPGAAALWPYVLARWIGAARQQTPGRLTP